MIVWLILKLKSPETIICHWVILEVLIKKKQKIKSTKSKMFFQKILQIFLKMFTFSRLFQTFICKDISEFSNNHVFIIDARFHFLYNLINISKGLFFSRVKLTHHIIVQFWEFLQFLRCSTYFNNWGFSIGLL